MILFEKEFLELEFLELECLREVKIALEQLAWDDAMVVAKKESPF